MSDIELMQELDRIAEAIAKRDRGEWAGWVVYLMDQMDAEHTGFGDRSNSLVWLEDVRKAIHRRMHWAVVRR